MCQPAIDILPAELIQPCFYRLMQSQLSQTGSSGGAQSTGWGTNRPLGQNDWLSGQFRRFSSRPRFADDPPQVIETGWRLPLPR